MKRHFTVMIFALLLAVSFLTWTIATFRNPETEEIILAPLATTSPKVLPAEQWDKELAKELYEFVAERGAQAQVTIEGEQYYIMLSHPLMIFGRDKGNMHEHFFSVTSRGALVGYRVKEEEIALFNRARDQLLAERDKIENGGGRM